MNNNLLYLYDLVLFDFVEYRGKEQEEMCMYYFVYTVMYQRLFQFIGDYKNVYSIAPTLCFILRDGAAISREMTECREKQN